MINVLKKTRLLFEDLILTSPKIFYNNFLGTSSSKEMEKNLNSH